MEDRLNQILADFNTKISQAKTLNELDEIFLALFGKNGDITLLPKAFASLSPEEKKVIGPLFNKVKGGLEKELENRRQAIREDSYAKLASESFNINSKVEIKERTGHLHPATKFKQEIIELFRKLGFQQFDAPHIELDKYNFEELNIPKDHPSR